MTDWTRTKPTDPGAYWIRGWNFDPGMQLQEALVQVKPCPAGRLMVNLHESNTDASTESWRVLASLGADFEWKPVALLPYSIDDDPHAIRERVSHAIIGAMAFGEQGVNPPPEGHWLTEFWQQGKRTLDATLPHLSAPSQPVQGDAGLLAMIRRLLETSRELCASVSSVKRGRDMDHHQAAMRDAETLVASFAVAPTQPAKDAAP